MFAQGSFLTTGNETPEQIARKREMLQLLMPRYGEARYIGQGLGQLAMGIGQGIQNRKLDRAEGEGRAGAMDRFRALLGGGQTSAPVGPSGGSAGASSYAPRDMTGQTGFTMRPETPNPGNLPASIISAVDRVAPNPAQPMTGQDVSARLMADLQRDFMLTPEQAAGFAGNLAHETGGFTKLQEIAPVVPGSRGGFGMAQWTGPRRVAFETWAAEKGLDPTSYEANYGFLQHELQNTGEGAVLEPLRAAQNPQDAARVVSDKFLRPGIPHMDSRMAFADQFANATPADYSNSPQMKSASVPTDALMGILSDPWQTPENKAIAQQMLDDQRKMSDPSYMMGMRADELAIKKAELELQQMQQPAPGYRTLTPQEAAQMGLPQGGVYQVGPDGKITVASDAPKGAPRPMTKEERAMWGIPETDTTPYAIGPDGTPKAIGGGGTSVTVNNGGGPDLGKLSTDYGYVLDPATGLPVIDAATGLPKAAPVPGSPAAREIAEADRKRERTQESKTVRLGPTLDSISLNLAEIENGGLPVTGALGDSRRTGIGSLLTGPSAVDFGSRTEQIKAAAAFSELQNMRDNSPTGGAVGQLTDGERAAIAASVTALNDSTSAEEYTRAAKAYRDLGLDLAYGKGKWALNPDGSVSVAAAETSAAPGVAAQTGAPEGVDPADWEAMTPEERALWD